MIMTFSGPLYHEAYWEWRRLTSEERAVAAKYIVEEPGKYTPWPRHFEQRNASVDPCDMWYGHCACGAFHKDGE